MALSARAQQLVLEFDTEKAKRGDIKKRAKEIKVDHELALELWSSQRFHTRMLALLILDKKRLTQASVEDLVGDMLNHDEVEQAHLSEWLLANQLMKDKSLTALIPTWRDHPQPILRRLFWYHQARLRWTGQKPPSNTPALMASLEQDLAQDAPIVQWAMNFCAGHIGVREPDYRARCVELGERLGLYKDEIVPKNCTPNYLPEFIRIEAAKLEG